MEVIINIINNFLNMAGQIRYEIIVGTILLLILTLVLVIGWKANRRNQKNMEKSLIVLKDKKSEIAAYKNLYRNKNFYD